VGPSAVTDANALNRWGTSWSRLLLRGVHGKISVGSARSSPPFILSRSRCFYLASFSFYARSPAHHRPALALGATVALALARRLAACAWYVLLWLGGVRSDFLARSA
jgi:hypothetical protein